MADGTSIGDAVSGIVEELKDQANQLVVGLPQQAAAQIAGKAPAEGDATKKQQKEIQAQQKMASLRSFLSAEAQKTAQLKQAYGQGEVTSSNTPSMSQLAQGSQTQSVGLQTMVRAKHAETKGNKSGE